MRTALFISALIWSVGAASAQPVQSIVSAGEHDGYSRLVFSNAGADISVQQDGRTVRLTNFSPSSAFDFQNINDRRKAHRVLGAKTVRGGAGAAVELQLTCDCTIRTSTLSNGRFVVDVVDASQQAAPQKTADNKITENITTEKKTPAAKDMLTQDDLISVEQAHSQMVELLKQAAREGLITIREEETAAQQPQQTAEAAPVENEPTVLTPPAAEQSAPEETRSAAAPESAPSAVEPITVAEQQPVAACYPNDRFAINVEDFEDEPLVRIAELQAALAENSEDAEKQDGGEAMHALVDGFLAIGFGEEALALLVDHGENESLRADMARIVAERPVSPDGALMGAKQCKGAHAVWQALASEPQAAAALYAGSSEAINSLPIMLRRLVASRLSMKMIDAGAWEFAEALFAIASEGLGALSPELEYIRARLDKHQGDYEGSHDTLLDLASTNSRAGDEALLALADSYTQDNLTPHKGFTEDIGALARLQGSSRAAMAEAQSWAGLGNVEAALILLSSVAEKAPGDRIAAGNMAKKVIDDALSSDDTILKISALDGYVINRDWLGDDTPAQNLRIKAARTAIDFALPNLGYALLDEAPTPISKELSLEKAAAALSAGYADEAITISAPYAADDAFAEIIVNANIAKKQHHAALAAASGISDAKRKASLTANAAWLARSWESALRNYQTIAPSQMTGRAALNYAFSAYMSGQRAMPAAAEAALSGQSETVVSGLRMLFATSGTETTALQRSRRDVKNTAEEIRFFEEVLSDG